MGRPYVKGGTPVGSVSICTTCSNGHIISGYRESEMVAICTDVHPKLVLQFSVRECSGYYDKNRPDYDQMQKLAIDVIPGPLKNVGFKLGVGFVPSSSSVEEEDND